MATATEQNNPFLSAKANAAKKPVVGVVPPKDLIENSGLATISVKRWFRALRTVNATKIFTLAKPAARPKPKKLCKCNLPGAGKKISESNIVYTDLIGEVRISRPCIERNFWRFINSNDWVEFVKVTPGALLDSLNHTIHLLMVKQKIIVYKTVEYVNIPPSDEAKETEKGNSKKKNHVKFHRVTKEHFCPIRHRRSSEFKESLIKTLRRIEKYKQQELLQQQQMIVENPSDDNTRRLAASQKYFLPRANRMFVEDCLDGILDFQLFKITTTSSEDWTTKREIFITRW